MIDWSRLGNVFFLARNIDSNLNVAEKGFEGELYGRWATAAHGTKWTSFCRREVRQAEV
jgi:hypothetical protein